MEDKIFSDLLKKIFIPILILLGTFGNLISIKIFSQDSMKKYTTFRYLTLLSLIDLCCLYTGCGQILVDVFLNIDIRTINEFFCKIQSFLVYFFTHYSSMLLAVMSIDRTVSIISRRAKKLSTPKSALNTFYLIGILMLVINLHFILFTELVEYEIPANNNHNNQFNNKTNINTVTLKFCYAPSNSIYFIYVSQVFPWVDLIFYVIGPFTVMSICSVIISIRAYLSSRNLRQSRNPTRSVSRNNQVFFILITTNTLFFCLVSPLVVLNAFGNIQENTAFTTIAYILAYANHALNFIFYGISCKSYRIEFLKIFENFKCKSNVTPECKRTILRQRTTVKTATTLIRCNNNINKNNNIKIPLEETKSFSANHNKN